MEGIQSFVIRWGDTVTHLSVYGCVTDCFLLYICTCCTWQWQNLELIKYQSSTLYYWFPDEWEAGERGRERGNNKIKYRPEATVVSWICIFMVFHDKLGFWVTSGLFHIHHKQQLCRRGASKADWRAGQSRQSRRAEDDSRKCQRCCWSSLEVKLFIQLGRNGGECASLHSPKHIIIVSCRSISPQLLTNRTPLLLEPPQRVFI